MRFDKRDVAGLQLRLGEYRPEHARERLRVWHKDRGVVVVLVDRSGRYNAQDLVAVRDGVGRFLEEDGADGLTATVSVCLCVEGLALSRRAEECPCGQILEVQRRAVEVRSAGTVIKRTSLLASENVYWEGNGDGTYRAAEHSPLRIAWHAKSMATVDAEHAVSSVIAGPVQPKKWLTFPAM